MRVLNVVIGKYFPITYNGNSMCLKWQKSAWQKSALIIGIINKCLFQSNKRWLYCPITPIKALAYIIESTA